MDTSRNQVVLKMIPRVDYTRKRGVLRSSDEEERKKKRRRPPAKLFDPDAIRYLFVLGALAVGLYTHGLVMCVLRSTGLLFCITVSRCVF